MEKIKLPTFKGKPLIEIPKFILQTGFLEGDFGKAFLEEYNWRADADYSGNPNLDILRYDNSIVKGSNPFAVVLANQILRQKGLRTVTQAELEKILRINALDLRGFYEDTSLVLRTKANPNKYLAKNLAEQIKSKGKKVKTPIVIPLNGLELVNDSNSPYDLAFDLTDESEIIYAPILNKEGGFDSEDIDEKIGLPRKTRSIGNRVLYTNTRNSGLSWLFLGKGLDLCSGHNALGFSYNRGRVVIVSTEGTSPEKLKDGFMKQIVGAYDAQIQEIGSRRKRAEQAVHDIMGGKK